MDIGKNIKGTVVLGWGRQNSENSGLTVGITAKTVITVNSRYRGHPRDRDLVSVIAGCEKIFILNHIYRRGSHVCSFWLTPVLFSDPLSQELYLQTEQNRSYVPFVYSSSSKYVKHNHRMLQQCPHMHRFGFLLYWSTVIYIYGERKYLDRLDELIHGSETAKRALSEKDEGILIDGQKKRKLTKRDKDSLKKQKK